MTYLFNRILFFTIAFVSIISVHAKNTVVRVLIDEQKKGTSWSVFAPEGFIIVDPVSKAKKIVSSTDLTISGTTKQLKINGKKTLAEQCILKARRGHTIVFNGKPYKGTFHVLARDNKWYLINTVLLDDYLHAVVSSESWPGWPLEVNKAFAIASRSYVISMMKRARVQGLPYHVRDDNNHQRYNLYGQHTSPVIARAVRSTADMVLVYNNEPIIAMFDACCGGVVPSGIQDFDFKKAPYLARDYPCSYCKKCRAYSWELHHDRTYIEQLLRSKNILVKNIKTIAVTKKDKAGVVLEVQVKDTHNKHHHIGGKKLYSLLDGVKSFAYQVGMKAGKVVFSGNGLGHHLGMCQWGAREMVKEGFSYKQILSFYYPGAQIKKLV